MSCAFGSSATSDLVHCLAEGVAFNNLRMKWCRRCSVPPATVAFWVRHPWLFNPESLCNTPTLIHAHVAFVGQACEHALSLFKSQPTVCAFLCVVDVAAVSLAARLPQHLLWMLFPAVLPCIRAPTALVVDGVSSRSSLPQGSHTCCDGVSSGSSLLQGSHSACCGCCSQLTSFAALTVYFLSFSCSCAGSLMPSCSICES